MLNDPINDTDHHVKRLCNGALLFASEELQDGNFVDSLVLICIHNADGAFGLILNRPTHMPLVEVFNIDPVYLNVRRSIYMGGPVDEEVLNILHITDTPATNAFRVQGRVFLGGEWSSVESILDENQEDVRMFLEYYDGMEEPHDVIVPLIKNYTNNKNKISIN